MEQAILVAIVIGLTEVIKRATGLEKRYIPLLAVILGVILSFIGAYLGVISATLISGITAGLVSVGLFSGIKNTFKKTE